MLLIYASKDYKCICFFFECLDVTWYTSVDMQLFIFAPLLVLLMKFNQKRFAIFSILLILLDYIYINYVPGNWYKYEISLILKLILQFCIQLYVIMQSIFYFFSGNRYTTLYSSTIHRFPAWLIGLNFGGFLHINRTHKFSIPNVR